MLALKNGVGGVSSGTRVELVEQLSKDDVVVYPASEKPDQDLYIETTTDNLVLLRIRVDEIPVNNRYARRAKKRRLYAATQMQ